MVIYWIQQILIIKYGKSAYQKKKCISGKKIFNVLFKIYIDNQKLDKLVTLKQQKFKTKGIGYTKTLI